MLGCDGAEDGIDDFVARPERALLRPRLPVNAKAQLLVTAEKSSEANGGGLAAGI